MAITTTTPPLTMLHHNDQKIMAPIIQTQPSELFARDIAAYSDAELDQYLEANGRSGSSGTFMISRVAKVHIQVH